MGKRQKLNFNSDELTHHLKQSTGKGVDALFSQQPSPPSTNVEGEAREGQEGNQAQNKTSLPIGKEPSREVPKPAPVEPTIEPTKQSTAGATTERPNETTATQRQKIRHTFDIFADQLLSLKEIQLDRERVFGKKCRIGDLAQEALDMLITKERNTE